MLLISDNPNRDFVYCYNPNKQATIWLFTRPNQQDGNKTRIGLNSDKLSLDQKSGVALLKFGADEIFLLICPCGSSS